MARITEATEIQSLPPMFGPGSVLLGRYEVEALLGAGGCGIVLRANDRLLHQPVAIKILRTDVLLSPDMEARLLREARVIAQLTSQHVVRIFDVGLLEHGAPFMVMELLHGADLGELFARGGAIPPAIAVDYVLQACDALAEAHALGIVHRDVKPSNLFVVAGPDGSDLVKVLDFGISKMPTFDGEVSLTHLTSVLGTPAYMSPEQMRSARSADARSDLWALGTVLYELVEGHLPITAGSFAELVVMASSQPYEPMVAAPQLAPVIARCLAKTPEARYANVAELASELAAFTHRPLGLACVARTSRVLGVPRRIDAPAGTRNSGVAPRAARVRRPIAVAGAVVAAITIATLIVAPRRDRAQPERAEQPSPAFFAPPAVAPPAVAPAFFAPPAVAPPAVAPTDAARTVPTAPAPVAPADAARTVPTSAAPVAPAAPSRAATAAPLVGSHGSQPAPPADSGIAPAPSVESVGASYATRAPSPAIRAPTQRTVARRAGASAMPAPAAAAPPPVVRADPSAASATQPATQPARPKPSGAGSNAGCDPYAKPEGC